MPIIEAKLILTAYRADPVLFDALVRKWQSTAERDSRVKQKGIAEVLEAGLERAETRLALAEHGPTSSNSAEIEISQLVDVEDSPEEWTEPKDKDSAWELWKKIIGQQFINGRDDQFNYEKIDDDESLDESEHENQALLENYIEQEEGHWEVNPSEVKGETGVQDF